MKKIILLLLATIFLQCELTASAQDENSTSAAPRSGGRRGGRGDIQQSGNETATRFNLDFPGGTPVQLVKAIETAIGKPLNTIISPEYGEVKIMPLKLRSVTVPEVFDALREGSVASPFGGGGGFGGGGRRGGRSLYSFRSTGNREDSIWVFFNEQQGAPVQRNVRYYQLGPYLEQYKIEDITTAVKTGWAMQHNPGPEPEISFHKDTKLLIAAGDPEKLKLIDSVLEQLKPVPKPSGTGMGAMTVPRKDEEPRE